MKSLIAPALGIQATTAFAMNLNLPRISISSAVQHDTRH
jgi:hypothetical protein